MKIKIKLLLSFVIIFGGLFFINSSVLAEGDGSGCTGQGGGCIYAECPAGTISSSNNDCGSAYGEQFFCCVPSAPSTSPSSNNACAGRNNGDFCILANPVNGSTRGSCSSGICWLSTSPGDPNDPGYFGSNQCSGSQVWDIASQTCVTPGMTPGSTTGNQGLVTKAKCVAPMTEGPGGVCYPSGTNLPDPSGGIQQVIVNLLYWLLGIFGFIAIIGFIVSGIQYIISTGSERTLDTAKRNMKYCIIGVVIALSGVIIITAINMALNANGFF